MRVSGTAVEVAGPGALARYAEDVGQPLSFHLFRVELTEVVRTYVQEAPESQIVLETWRPGHPLRTIRRGNGDAPPTTD